MASLAASHSFIWRGYRDTVWCRVDQCCTGCCFQQSWFTSALRRHTVVRPSPSYYCGWPSALCWESPIKAGLTTLSQCCCFQWLQSLASCGCSNWFVVDVKSRLHSQSRFDVQLGPRRATLGVLSDPFPTGLRRYGSGERIEASSSREGGDRLRRRNSLPSREGVEIYSS